MQLTIRGLSKTYSNGVRALDDVSLSIASGMFGLLGPNGAGKSTLMRTIATLQDADQGTADLDGLDVLQQKHEVRKLLGYLPQEFGLDPKAVCQDLLDHFAGLKGIPAGKERTGSVEAMLRQTNLWEHRRKRLGGFSGGMKQRFGIAQALLGDPRLLIVDEPTAGLDPEERQRFHNLLAEIGQNVVVILSTHIVDDVSDLCGSMAIIHKGRVLRSGTPQGEVAALAGRIWTKEVDKASLPDLRGRMTVISTRLYGGRTIARIHSERDPGDGFAAAAPDLEDVYFSTIRLADAAFNGGNGR
ncbi:MAG: ABC transporter ATP-binding protein [Candidatus Edwardsbacteria bacterium]|jgi:ABC-type multidrug transport system ATPase subunit|nr:ABC transporter ATP-binding protein [Candidatus Edwardsbacteria bacterium]